MPWSWDPWAFAIGWPIVIFLVIASWRSRRAHATVNRRLGTFVAVTTYSRDAKARNRPARSWHERWRQGPNAAILRLRASEYLLFRIGGFVIPFAVGALVRGLIGGFILGIIGSAALSLYFRVKRQRWLNKAEEALPEFLRGVASTLRAGSSLTQAMRLVAQETVDPLGGEILRVLHREALGFNLSETLEELTRRIPSRDLSLAVLAISIQREVGGSLADLLENIVKTIVDRQHLKTEVRIVTSQGRYSGWVLTALPFLLGLLMWFIDPQYISPLFHSTIGWGMAGAAVISVSLGGFFIHRLVQSPEM